MSLGMPFCEAQTLRARHQSTRSPGGQPDTPLEYKSAEPERPVSQLVIASPGSVTEDHGGPASSPSYTLNRPGSKALTSGGAKAPWLSFARPRVHSDNAYKQQVPPSSSAGQGRKDHLASTCGLIWSCRHSDRSVSHSGAGSCRPHAGERAKAELPRWDPFEFR